MTTYPASISDLAQTLLTVLDPDYEITKVFPDLIILHELAVHIALDSVSHIPLYYVGFRFQISSCDIRIHLYDHLMNHTLLSLY